MAELADGPQGVMAGLVPAIHAAQLIERRQARSPGPSAPPPVALTRDSFLRRRSVDGRDKPGHDGKGSRNNR
jgi:hypothetical protein